MMRIVLVLGFSFTVALAGCEKKKTKPSSNTLPTGSVETASSGGGGGGTNYQSGAGVAQNVRQAPRRIVEMNDLNQIRIYIENASLASGKMPNSNEILAALKQEAPAIYKKINDGDITLHPARTREEVWAYETAALTQGGLVCTSSGVERMDAATLKQRLGR